MTQQVLNNPEMLRQALDNPLVQSMTSNPELMRSIMMSNPEMQNLMEVSLIRKIPYRTKFRQTKFLAPSPTKLIKISEIFRNWTENRPKNAKK